MDGRIRFGSSEWWNKMICVIDEPTCKLRGILTMEDPSLMPTYYECLKPALDHLEAAEKLLKEHMDKTFQKEN